MPIAKIFMNGHVLGFLLFDFDLPTSKNISGLKVKNLLKGSPDLIPSPSLSVKFKLMVGKFT